VRTSALTEVRSVSQEFEAKVDSFMENAGVVFWAALRLAIYAAVLYWTVRWLFG
jgi:hypothetical protein